MEQTKKIYIASPLGFSEIGREYMYNIIIPKLEKLGFEILDPWTLTDESIINPILALEYGKEKKQSWKKANKIIAKNNEKAIKKSDIIFTILDGVDIDSGTASEIGYAYALGKKILGYRGDFRLSADNEGSKVNLQVQHFIENSGGKIINQINDLEKEIITL